MPASAVVALQDFIEGIAADEAVGPSDRVRELRRLRADLDSLAGLVDRLMGDQELEREAGATRRQRDRAVLRENADIRAEMLRRGMASPEQLDAAGLWSHEELDRREADGTLEEAVFGGVHADPAKLAAAAKKRRRSRGGQFADEFRVGVPPKLKGRGGRALGTPNRPGGSSAEATAAASAAAAGGTPSPDPKPAVSALPETPPKPPQSPGTTEAIAGIKAIDPQNVLERLREVREFGLNDWPTKGPVAERLFGDAKDSQDFHSEQVPASPGTKGEGVPKRRYKAERRALHDQIVGRFLAQSLAGFLGEDHELTQKLAGGGRLSSAEKQQVRDAAAAARGGGAPRALFMAGGPASGKTSALRQAPELEPDASVLINPDEIKDRLPEYRQMVEGGDKFGAAGVHEESSDLGKRLQAETMDLGLNVVVDGTGDSKPGKFVGKLQDMNDAGYEVSALYVTIPTDEAVIRTTLRAMKRGRWVPEPELRSQHKHVSANFEDVAALPFLKDLKLYDNGGDAPQLVAEAAGGDLTKHNEPLYDEFIAKREE
jgi:predicted ABC-type ATPase